MKSVYDNLGDIVVYCNEPSHDGVPYFVAAMAVFVIGKDGREHRTLPESEVRMPLTRVWVPQRRLTTGPSSQLNLGSHNVLQAIAADRIYDPLDWTVDDSQVRGRYNFRCGTCGLGLTRKSPPVDAVFEVLLSFGVRTIALRGLAARL